LGVILWPDNAVCRVCVSVSVCPHEMTLTETFSKVVRLDPR